MKTVLHPALWRWLCIRMLSHKRMEIHVGKKMRQLLVEQLEADKAK